MRKRWKWIIICLAALLLCRFAWIFWPSKAVTTFYIPETKETVQEVLTYQEAVAVKKALFFHVRWPEWLYGYPACGFGEMFSITIDGVCYMPAWDSCEMVAVRGLFVGRKYINVTQQQKEMLEEIITGIDE